MPACAALLITQASVLSERERIVAEFRTALEWISNRSRSELSAGIFQNHPQCWHAVSNIAEVLKFVLKFPNLIVAGKSLVLLFELAASKRKILFA